MLGWKKEERAVSMRIKFVLTVMVILGVVFVFLNPRETILEKAPPIKVMVNQQAIPYQTGVIAWNNQYVIRDESTTAMLMNRKLVPALVSAKDKIYLDLGEYPPDKAELRLVYFLSSNEKKGQVLSEEEFTNLFDLPNDQREYQVKRILAGTIEQLGRGKYVISYKPELTEPGIQQISVLGYWNGDKNRAEYSFFLQVVE